MDGRCETCLWWTRHGDGWPEGWGACNLLPSLGYSDTEIVLTTDLGAIDADTYKTFGCTSYEERKGV